MANTPNAQEVPVKIVGSSTYGRYPIINAQRTYNMYESDGWLINFAGYREALSIITETTEGRGLFHSIRGNFLLIVIGSSVYKITPGLGVRRLSVTLPGSTGEVFMDENLSEQICIVANNAAFIYNYNTGIDAVAPAVGLNADLLPNYVTYQNTYFIFGNAATGQEGAKWYVYQSDYQPSMPSTAFDLVEQAELLIQTKPDSALAAIRIPGHGNNLLLLGSSVGEIWTQTANVNVYTRNSSINIDYGVASVSTIAANDEMVAWLGINERSAPAVMAMAGGQAQRISTDGIDYLLSTVQFPRDSTALFYRQDGHLFYVLTFYNEADNFTVTYDFTTNKFYDLTDWDFTYHPARQIAYFDGGIYFASIKQGSLMQLDTNLTTISTDITNSYEIPRVRITDTFRLPGSERFIANLFSFTIENGVEQDVNFQYECDGYILGEISGNIMYTEDDLPILVEGGSCQIYRPRIDLTISKNGGETFSNALQYYMHATGKYKNQPRFYKLGEANQLTFQFRFWGTGRVAIFDGVVEVYK